MIFEESMALLLKAEDIKGLISIEEAIAAVESGFRDQGKTSAIQPAAPTHDGGRPAH